ncbi:MAG: helix-turn-helix transcriptional regulator [Desulfitobacteriaceae bacterium]|nr:helix-turn-helix transcriptional regulator [Desulfitobacteriaceae bacterium]
MYSEFIRAKRKELGLTQEKLAERIGVSRMTIYDWESGKYPPTNANNIAAIEDVFQLERGTLFKILQDQNPTLTPAGSQAQQGTQ